MCHEKGESVNHIVSDCSKLASTRHDNMARYVHWAMGKKANIERANEWYNQQPSSKRVQDTTLWQGMCIGQCVKRQI